MARQSTTPVTFDTTIRGDEGETMTSGRAGLVVPVLYVPLLRGDSASGRVGIDVELGHMPKPTLNGVMLQAQAWFVPKTAHPKYANEQEFIHSFQEQPIKALGVADRVPPAFYTTFSGAQAATIAASKLFRTLGIHVPPDAPINSDLIDAFVLIYNFRLAAHSSKLARRKYAAENLTEATSLPRAFWPATNRSQIVPDYERALVVGAMSLDVSAGNVVIQANAPVSMAANPNTSEYRSQRFRNPTSGAVLSGNSASGSPDQQRRMGIGTGAASGMMINEALVSTGVNSNAVNNQAVFDPGTSLVALTQGIVASFGGSGLTASLADIDKARLTQAFAQLRTAYGGTDTTGFANDDAIIAELMQGFSVNDEQQRRRPWLLDSRIVSFGMLERMATDGASLDLSSTQGRAAVTLSLNVPRQEHGGYIFVTLEVLPERIDERQCDDHLTFTSPRFLPDALRDVQRTEPVDQVLNRRLDAKHTAPNAVYGFEPMNNIWNRRFTRLGGVYYQETPGSPWTEQRSAIWLPEIVNPTFTAEHYLAPAPFPHDVFSYREADAFEATIRHSVRIAGLTQFGDVLSENNDDYKAVQEQGEL